MSTENKLKPCPFCGLQSDTDWEDTLYTSGSGWREVQFGERKIRHYMGRKDYHEWQGACYEINCAVTYGGCGVNISADSIPEVIQKWNRRVE